MSREKPAQKEHQSHEGQPKQPQPGQSSEHNPKQGQPGQQSGQQHGQQGGQQQKGQSMPDDELRRKK